MSLKKASRSNSARSDPSSMNKKRNVMQKALRVMQMQATRYVSAALQQCNVEHTFTHLSGVGRC